jgi:urea transport system permease protein
MAVVIPAVFAIIIGYPTFRSGIRGVYFSILTQAMALAMSILFIGQQPYTGGTNGMTNFQSLAGISLYKSGMRLGLYLATVVTLAGVVALALWLVRTRTGTVLMAIRDGENRLRFLGYNPVRYKLVTFALSAGIAGFAGALFVPQVGIISPSSMSILPSVEMAIWVAVGGRGTIVGAAVGAVVVNWAKTFFSESLPEAWLYVFGGLFIGVVLLFPRGLAGIAAQLGGLLRKARIGTRAAATHRNGAAAAPVAEPVAAATEQES